MVENLKDAEKIPNGKIKSEKRSKILVFYVNGVEIRENQAEPEWTLLYYLRNKLGLTGTKLGCAEGGCGACTVMISRYNRETKEINNFSVNACLMPLCALHGLSVVTVEGIGSTRTKLHPVQERIAKAHGSQCGFCTPGMVMSMYSLLRSNPCPKMENLKSAIDGNLCRCTGYRPILEGFKTFTKEWEESQKYLKNGSADEETLNDDILKNSISKDGVLKDSISREGILKDETSENETIIKNGIPKSDTSKNIKIKPKNTKSACPMGENCCKRAFTSEPNELFDSKAFRPYDPTQEPIFPPKLMISSQLDEEYLIIKGKNATWYRPNNLEDLLTLKNIFPNSKIVVGNTEVGVEVKFKNCHYPILIQPTRIKEMNEITENDQDLEIGANVTLSDVESLLQQQIKIKEESKTRIFVSIIKMLYRFAGMQIRNVASIGGNIVTSSPISDLNPLFLAAGVKLKLASSRLGFRTLTMDHHFMTGYRKNLIESDEVLVSISLPFSLPNQYFVAYKQARRRDDDIAIVNMALNLFIGPQSQDSASTEEGSIQKMNIAFGGMGPTTIVAKETSESLVGEKWNKEILEKVYSNLLEELPLSGDAPGGMISYRRSLTLSLFYKAFSYIENQRLKQTELNSSSLKQQLKSFSKHDESSEFVFKDPKSSQYFQVVTKNQSSWDLIGKPVVHTSALKQATGEALFCDDVQQFKDELHLAFVLSTKAHANILKIDSSEALAVDGVIAFFDASDINISEIAEDKNLYELIAKDEPIFASKTVHCQGRPIGAIAAVDQLTAQKAAALVKIDYEPLPSIITIEDAIIHKSFFPGYPTSMVSGNPDEEFQKADHVLTGEVKIGGQEHFYLETQATVAIPRDGDGLEVFCSTQNPSEVQKLIAHLLGLPSNKITIRVQRIGGGFGGKDTRASMVALPVAFIAYKLQKPVRCMLDRSEDMMMTGNRHPFLHKYKIGFDKNGLIKVAEVEMYLNAGCTLDVSGAVLDRGLFHFENSYKIPYSRVTGYLCKTNLPSNVAFRGFGGPQSMFLAENMIRDVAECLHRDEMDLMELNFYKEGDVTHYNQRLDYCTLDRCWQECLRSSDFRRRKAEVDEFNKSNRCV